MEEGGRRRGGHWEEGGHEGKEMGMDEESVREGVVEKERRRDGEREGEGYLCRF